MMRLFAYGTLMWPEIMAGVIGRKIDGRPAVLSNARRLKVKNEVYPSLISAACGEVNGILYENLTPDEIHALDRFEGPEYDRREVSVHVDGLPLPAETYFTSAEGMKLVEDSEWTIADLPPEKLQQFRRLYKGWST